MKVQQSLPDTNRLSVVTAMVLLAYALTPFVNIPGEGASIQLPGFLFQVRFDIASVISALVIVLAATGTNYLIQDHPRLEPGAGLPHWLLPALTAWAIQIPLRMMQVSLQWWVVFALGGVLFVMVLVAEYIVVDPADVRHAPASIGLTAVSFALLLVLVISTAAANQRLYSQLFILVPAIFLVSLRTLYLRTGGRWALDWAIAITLIVAQIAVGFHYLPVSPLRFGLMFLGVAYSVTALAGGILEGRPLRNLWVEPVIMSAVLWGLALIIRG